MSTPSRVNSLHVYKELIASFERQNYKNVGVYWLEGEEDFFIDEAIREIEKNTIPEEFKTFNQIVLFGQDVSVTDLMATAKQVPFGYERQLVVVRDAQQIKSLDQLSHYVDRPSPYTLLVLAHKNKKLDKRSILFKVIQKKGQYVYFCPLSAREMETWTATRIHHYGIKLSPKASEVLLQHIGNNLPLMDGELKKLSLNVPQGTTINETYIYQHIGVNREYNTFELQSAIAQRDITKAYQIIQHFERNEKAHPLQPILMNLYNYFAKVYMLYGAEGTSKMELATLLGVPHFFLEQYLQGKRYYSLEEVSLAIQLINLYYKKSVGIDVSIGEREGLLSTFFFKMIHLKELLSYA